MHSAAGMYFVKPSCAASPLLYSAGPSGFSRVYVVGQSLGWRRKECSRLSGCRLASSHEDRRACCCLGGTFNSVSSASSVLSCDSSDEVCCRARRVSRPRAILLPRVASPFLLPVRMDYYTVAASCTISPSPTPLPLPGLPHHMKAPAGSSSICKRCAAAPIGVTLRRSRRRAAVRWRVG